MGATYSWIEDVSQVEFSSTEGQETPLHIGDKVLKSDAVIKNNPSTDVVNLNDYFYPSGDMHLSPCYSNGEKFYFPVEKKSAGNVTFREGTKDDANVNYLSATFRVRSEGANTAFWFEKSGTNNDTPFISFKKGDSGVSNSNLEKYLRFSVTIDGSTNVYALNSDGTYYMVNSTTAANASANTGRSIDQYTYYKEAFNQNAPEGYYKNSANITNKPNQGAGNNLNGKNLNGNTIFNVNQYDTQTKSGLKTVTVKIWLEYNSADSTKGVDLASVNMNMVSSWAKTRRIYVKDATLRQENYTQAKWLSTQSAKLYWGLRDNLDSHWELTKITGTDYYFVDIPAVYNNTPAVLFRCNGSWGAGSQTYPNSSVKYWDKWDTIFPDTFHSETFTVYSTDFGTWEEASNVHSVFFANSAFFSNVYDYMWDSKSVNGSGINDKVVKNADWPGTKMTTKMYTKTNSQSLDTYAFFYNSDYDRIIFNDGNLVAGQNQEYQTQDLWLTDDNGNPLNLVNGTFDMATLTWFHTNPTKSDWSTKMPSYSGSTTYLYGNFSTNNAWKKTRFAWGGEYGSTGGDAFNGTNSGNMLAKVYVKSAGDFEFIVYYNGTCYKTYPENVNLYSGGNITLYPEGENNTKNVYAKNLKKGTVYRFYMKPGNGNVTIYLSEGEATSY